MATYTAVAGGGNWSADATWGGGGHPVAGDTALLDASSGAVVVDTNSACTTLDLTGYTSTLALGTFALTVSGNVTIGTTVGSVATLTIGISGGTGLSIGGDLLVNARGVITCVGASKVYCSGSWDVSAGTFTPSTSTVTFKATTTGTTVKSGSNTYNDVIWNGSGGAWTLLSNMTMGGNSVGLFVAGTLNLGGYTFSEYNSVGGNTSIPSGFTVNVGSGTLTLTNHKLAIPTGALLTISTGTLVTEQLNISGSGTLTVTGAATIQASASFSINTSSFCDFGTSTLKTLYYTGDLASNQPLYNLTLDAAVVSYTKTLTSNLTVLNNLTIVYSTGKVHTLSAGSHTLNIGGNFTNGDVFTCGTGTVVFNDASKISTISGSTTFNVLSCTTPDKTVKFTHGQTFTVASLVLTGTSGHNVILTSVSGAATFALSDAAGTNSVNYCTISYSAAAGGATWEAYTSNGCVDAGGNSGWVFAGASSGNMLLMFD